MAGVIVDSQRLRPQTLLGETPPWACSHTPGTKVPADRGGQGLGPTYNSRLEGGLDFLLLQQHPVNLLEEGVLFDGVFPVLCRHTAQALVRILGHELWEEGTRKLLMEAPRHGL